MHVEDKKDLLATTAKIQRELQRLLSERPALSRRKEFERIGRLARYLQEHVEMIDVIAPNRKQTHRRERHSSN
jgi:hypothetical protein